MRFADADPTFSTLERRGHSIACFGLRGPEAGIHVSDAVDLKLYRESGDLAGSLAQLSDGQRNTAMLSILLAQGDNPIVIDQPEDEVDSDYVFRELVPLLRRVKQNRQIILNTHNANLPVNGDAELVYALECKEGRGHLRAQGGMDREPVKQAILDIMEGSKAAFERRREKYKF